MLSRHHIAKYGTRHIEDTKRYYNILASAPCGADKVIHLIEERCFGGEYYDFHKKRFCELHGLVSAINTQTPMRRLLEISTMPFTTSVWKSYLRNLDNVTTLDLPETRGGPSLRAVKNYGADKHIPADLNYADFDRLNNKLTEDGLFDIIVATEVVEHLERDFEDVSKLFIKCLAPNGTIIVTTPNATRVEYLSAFVNGRNIQQRFINYDRNSGGHYHFREYTMQELVKCVETVGGKTLLQSYSHCFGNEEGWSEDAFHLRSNIVLTFGHA
jgi:predicted SAM-dependent methyltransferase